MQPPACRRRHSPRLCSHRRRSMQGRRHSSRQHAGDGTHRDNAGGGAANSEHQKWRRSQGPSSTSKLCGDWRHRNRDPSGTRHRTESRDDWVSKRRRSQGPSSASRLCGDWRHRNRDPSGTKHRKESKDAEYKNRVGAGVRAAQRYSAAPGGAGAAPLSLQWQCRP